MAGDLEAAALQRSLQTQGGIATGLLVGGGVAVALGTAWFFLLPDAPASVSLSADGAGAAVHLSGRF